MIKRSHRGKRLAAAAAGGALMLLHGWAVLALYCWFSGHPALAWGAAAGYAVATAAVFKLARTWPHGALVSLVPFAAVAVWWTGRTPETGLHYPVETELAAKLVVDGSLITVNGLRDFRYRSETDFDPRWATRTFDLGQLEHVDFFFNYWGVPEVAHLITSFVFKDQPPLAVSIELRAEAGEPNTLLRGFFKQYELHYLWADERDLIPLHANCRREQVMLHRSSLTPDQGGRLLLDMAQRSNALEEDPVFYNTLTDNCTNVIVRHVDRAQGRVVPWYRQRLLTGKYERLGYDEGWLVHTLPWEQHRAAAMINGRAAGAAASPDFSRLIRTHLPVPVVEQYPAE